MHGHITTSCEFMAKLLIANEMLSKAINQLTTADRIQLISSRTIK
jgi:hypothetical protein